MGDKRLWISASRNSTRRLMVAAALITLAGCANDGKTEKSAKVVQEPIVANSFAKFLEANGYTILALPSGYEEAGSLVKISKEDTKTVVTWLTTLQSCGVPEDTLFPRRDQNNKPIKAEPIPGFKSDQGYTFDAKAGLSVPYISFKTGVSGQKESTESIDVKNAGTSRIDRVRTHNFLTTRKTRDKLTPNCLKLIQDRSVAVVVDSAFIQDGTIIFKDSTSGGAELSADKVKKIVDISVNANAKIGSTGTVTFSNLPIYVGVKDAFYVPGLGTLGESVGSPKSAVADLSNATIVVGPPQ